MIGSDVIVIIPVGHGRASISLAGELRGGNGQYYIDGNPSLLFYTEDVQKIDDPAHNKFVIRLA